MAYKELIHSYQYEVPEDGPISGRRVFIQVPTGTPGSVASLPIVGTSLLPDETGTNLPGVRCRRKRVVRDSNDKNPQYHFEYSAATPGSTGGTMGISTDPGDRSLDVQVEMLSFEDRDNVWGAVIGNDVAPSFDLNDRAVYKRTVLIPFAIPRANLSDSAYTALLAIVKDRAGTINTAAFEGYNIGQVLFEGIRGGTYTDANGNKRWNIELIFRARLLTGENSQGIPITQDDWNYIWDTYWLRPQAGVGNFLYRKTDFSSLL